MHADDKLNVFVSPFAEIRDGNLKAILGLFFSLSRYKQQQQQQYQDLIELQQQVQHQSLPASSGSPQRAQPDMQSRLPGPSRGSAAGSTTKVQGANSLNRRSQSFNSIDKNKPLQNAGGSEKGNPLRYPSVPSLFPRFPSISALASAGSAHSIVVHNQSSAFEELQL
ncbi:hypothetical protein chiPu_0021352 [Chiloscyllium punctatum]|uniref:Calponin-homology (CH) domain-containing protein n=1 Tax=Chiloscyllium punctatum TaxID=137246 RepID=A0A401RE12_CHIPU|nr:hypothetical protein [Chiloscyllium punctatum]